MFCFFRFSNFIWTILSIGNHVLIFLSLKQSISLIRLLLFSCHLIPCGGHQFSDVRTDCLSVFFCNFLTFLLIEDEKARRRVFGLDFKVIRLCFLRKIIQKVIPSCFSSLNIGLLLINVPEIALIDLQFDSQIRLLRVSNMLDAFLSHIDEKSCHFSNKFIHQLMTLIH